ncbi:MAG: HAD family hydrolase [Puniceicoccales bacterium]|nr:HAD family hydrolase [Puniceicoccales bacterium]
MESLEAVARDLGYGGAAMPPLRYPFETWMAALYTRLQNSGLFARETAFADFCAAALEVEERVEVASQVVNGAVVDLLREWKSAGKRIYVVSDFYLPKRSLLRFLEAGGLGDFFDDVFVSCDLGETKQEGGLYGAVLARLGVAPSEVFMFGDNRVSDCWQARRAGLAAEQIRGGRAGLVGKAWRFLLARRGANEPLRQTFERAFLEHERECQRGGVCFAEYALVFYFFTERLFFRLKERGVQEVVFLSREGWLLKEFFEMWQTARVPEGQRLRTHYLRMSRQAAAILRLRDLETEDFAAFANAGICVRDFLAGCGFSAAQTEALALEVRVDFAAPTTGVFRGTSEFAALSRSAAFRRLYAENLAENKEAFRRYWAGFGIAPDALAGVVDVGWTGRMQDALHALAGQRTAGFYLGLRSASSLGAGREKEGVLFSCLPARTAFFHHLSANRQIYEQLLMAPHGTATGYGLDAAGQAFVREDDKEAERGVYDSQIRAVQEEMRGAFGRLCADARLGGYAPEWLLRRLADLTVRSSLFATGRRADFMRAVSQGFVDNFGAVRVGVRYNIARVLVADGAGGAGGAGWSVGRGLRLGRGLLRVAVALLLRPENVLRYAAKMWAADNAAARLVWRCGGAWLCYRLFFKPRKQGR